MVSLEIDNTEDSSLETQLCGFKLGDGYYAVPVLEVQEVVKPQRITKVPLAPGYVNGLLNLRGQIVTSLNLRKLFGIEGEEPDDHMNVIVREGDSLFSLVVDEILDVIELDEKTFEAPPETLSKSIKKYVNGVHKLDDKLLVCLNLKSILDYDIISSKEAS